MIHTYGKNSICKGTRIFEPVFLGFPSIDHFRKTDYPGATIGDNAVFRTGTIIYSNVTIGNNFSTGHNVINDPGTYHYR
jgi:acetyltransferase-like isoleucine patch superfamily enzyme